MQWCRWELKLQVCPSIATSISNTSWHHVVCPLLDAPGAVPETIKQGGAGWCQVVLDVWGETRLWMLFVLRVLCGSQGHVEACSGCRRCRTVAAHMLINTRRHLCHWCFVFVFLCAEPFLDCYPVMLLCVCVAGEIADMKQLGVWEPTAVKAQTFKTSIESAVMLLRIDDIVSGISKKAAGGGGGGGGGAPQVRGGWGG